MAFSSDSLRGVIEEFVSNRRADAEQKGIALPEDLQDASDVVITTHQEVQHVECPLLNDLRKGFRKNLLGAIDRGIHEELRRLRGLNEKERRPAIKDFLNKCLDKSFELFWGTFESMCRFPDELNPENPEDFLAFNEDIASALIETVRENDQSVGIYRNIDSQIGAYHECQRKPITFFRGASVPDTFPLFERFADLCSSNDVKYEVFERLRESLNKLVLKATGGEQAGYPISGVLQGWIEFFTCMNGITRDESYAGDGKPVITTTHEYFPMLKRVGNVVVVGGDNEDEICVGISSELHEGSDDKYKRRIILMSSVHRDGRRMDVNKIMSYVANDFPEVCFVIDAAQDHAFYPFAHCVIYGKRFGGTGTGIIMIKGKDREGLPEEVGEKYHFDSGFNIRDLANTFSAVRCELTPVHFANDFRDLLTSKYLWRFRGSGTYIDSQVQHIRQFKKTHSQFDANFEVVTSPDQTNYAQRQWRSYRIISFRKRRDSRVSVKSIAKYLYDQKKIQVDWFSLEEFPEYKGLLTMAQKEFSPDVLEDFIYALKKFQDTYFNYIIDPMLLLPEVFNGFSHDFSYDARQDLYRRQTEFFLKYSKEQEMIRILIDVRMTEDDIESFLEAFNDAILCEQQAAQMS